MKYVAGCCVVLALGMVGFLMHEAKVFSYLSSDAKVCINCHTMNAKYASWQHSSHRDLATCVDCHLPRNSLVDKMLAKSRDGFNHAVAMTLGSYGNNLMITSNAARRIQANCIACHRQEVSQMLANSELYQIGQDDVPMGRQCWDCHRGLPHGRINNLLASRDNLGVKEL